LVEHPSNIDNGLGIFTGVNSNTLYLEEDKKNDIQKAIFSDIIHERAC